MEVALDLFSRRDFAGVTTRDIAKECDVNVALIYYYFKNKDVLFQAVIQHGIEQALARYRERVVTADSPLQALNEWFQVNIELFTPLRKLSQVLVSYNIARPGQPIVDALIKKLYRNEQRILYRCVRAGTEQRQFRDVDARQAAVFISTHLDGLFFVSLTRPWADVRPLVITAWQAILDYLGVDRKLRDAIAAVRPAPAS